MVFDQAIYERLRENGRRAARSGLGPQVVRLLTGHNYWLAVPFRPGVDHLLARHIAHLFIRDPLAIYKELLDQDDTKSSDHFEVRLLLSRSVLRVGAS